LARKILLADDSVTAQNMGRKILADAGYEVIAVNNGSAALKKIAELKPDLVILDVYMPGYSGLEVCQRLKESQDTARIPVLLSVGKLEPFKPEEAQRVRADGYIVKPFEASELLSALSKLEDKVVPRAEPSKPGRFARAMAAAEESSRASKKETASDTNGWNSRIGFPHEKTGPEEKVADESTFYNPMNRDLRTVVATAAEKAAEKKEEQQPAARVEDSSVDVAALAPAGLPKDVTPAEVAAIAAAAAQMQRAGAAAQVAAQVAPHVTRSASFEPQISESRISEFKVSGPELTEPQISEPLTSEPQVHETTVTGSTGYASFDPPSARVEESVAPAVEGKVEEEVRESVRENKIDAVAGEVAGAPAESRIEADTRAEDTQDQPVTMAATAEFVSEVSAGGSRWTATPVALEADEATISLEEEMQKAYAAYAAYATPDSADVASAPEVEAAPPENSYSPEVVAPVVDAAPAENAFSSEPVPVEAHADISPATEVAEPNPAPAPDVESVGSAEETVVADPASPVVMETESSQPQESQLVPEVVPATSEVVTASSSESAHGFAPIERGDEPTAEYKPESEAIKSTAAAWASWRQIRDTRQDGEVAQARPKEFEAPEAIPAETAAAVAAGAEQTLQEASSSPKGDSPDVASIVESVLANLRPKLMEEISRKMAEKK
jgi:CheY-like chemotaxis protein